MPDTSVLPDVLGRNLALVFCGTGAGRKSAEVGAYYAKPGNRFWPTLHEIGLTPTLFDPRRFADVLKLGIGLTDIAKQHIGQDHEIDLAGVDAAGLSRKIRQFAPGILAFTSKKAASLFFAKPTGLIGYGLQSETIGATRIFVLTSPSGQARKYWDITPWRELAVAVAKGRCLPP